MQDPEVQKGLQELKKKADELAQNRPKDKEPAPRGKEGKNDAAKKEGDNASSKGKEGKEDTAQGDPKQDPKADPKNSKDPKMDKGELAKKDQEGNKLGGKAPKDGNLKGELPVNPASGGGEDKIDPMVADLKNKVKAAELQLEDFRKNKSNKEMLKQVEMTPEQYEQFLKSAEEALNRERQRLVELEKKEAKSGSRSKGASMLNRGSETIKLEGNSDSKTERGTRGNAPPGFDDAYKRATSGSASGSGDPK
jgi:ribonuclease E